MTDKKEHEILDELKAKTDQKISEIAALEDDDMTDLAGGGKYAREDCRYTFDPYKKCSRADGCDHMAVPYGDCTQVWKAHTPGCAWRIRVRK